MAPDSDTGRKRGILSPADRAYLFDPEKYVEEKSRQSVLERKEAIRERLRDGVLDFPILLEHVPDSMRKAVFGSGGWFQSPEGAGELANVLSMDRAIADGVAFLYMAGWDNGINSFQAVEEGVRKGEERRGPWVADVDLEVKTNNMESLAGRAREKMELGEELTNAEVRALLETGFVDPDDVAEHIRG